MEVVEIYCVHVSDAMTAILVLPAIDNLVAPNLTNSIPEQLRLCSILYDHLRLCVSSIFSHTLLLQPRAIAYTGINPS